MDEIDYALDIGKKVLDLHIECGGKEAIKGFRSRAREFPQMVQQLGLISSITFLLSKVDDDILIPSIKYFLYGEKIDRSTNLCREVRDDGYTSYLVVNFAWIKCKLYDLRFFDKCIKEFESLDDMKILINDHIKKDIISTLKELKEEEEKNLLLSQIEESVLNFSIELKKIVDGIYGGSND
ncbi:type III-B CRISPR module-associated protein Cmr5 [Acidianus sp. HS-5]|uniref:type III-B CRISPR module-associated protein Cmr5 n=1 Tax=Acidianus sp. HS-5 TaxID=2886040 RepID=UPI001F02E9A4|nr:type III-B CRISPR module-associated protein Cmr5 [Acidianus sp. HS-5]BDC18770.1 hypothetical protein HS5_16600 [Acidianus sp. HS-5]